MYYYLSFDIILSFRLSDTVEALNFNVINCLGRQTISMMHGGLVVSLVRQRVSVLFSNERMMGDVPRTQEIFRKQLWTAPGPLGAAHSQYCDL